MSAAAIRWIAAACLPAALSCCGPTPGASAHPPARPASAAAEPGPSKPAPKPGKITRLPLDRFFALQQNRAALIYDVRPGFSYGKGHIPGAISWPKGQFAAQLAAREAEIRAARAAKLPVVLYCTDLACQDSNKVAGSLAALGHSVFILDGGFASWKTAELPIE